MSAWRLGPRIFQTSTIWDSSTPFKGNTDKHVRGSTELDLNLKNNNFDERFRYQLSQIGRVRLAYSSVLS